MHLKRGISDIIAESGAKGANGYKMAFSIPYVPLCPGMSRYAHNVPP